MFGRKACQRCNKKTSKKSSFCPNCGYSFNGKDSFFEPSFKIGFPFNMLFKQLEKQIEKEFKNIDKSLHESPPTFDENIQKTGNNSLIDGISISVSSSDDGQPIIKVNKLGNERAPEKAKAIDNNLFSSGMSEEKLKKFSNLPKEEPKANVRRFADRIIYEINLPGVTEDNVLLIKFQNSIEIKAFTKDRAFFKLIPIALPILKTQLKEGKLILELKPDN